MSGGTDPLLEPFSGARFRPRNRVLFGPHETNLGTGRAVSERHVAYYRRRAAGGCGTVVVETASVHPSDWPYERAPLAAACRPGWAAVARALHDEGALGLASLGHAGGQGSSAYGQEPLWGPSGFPDPVTREVPLVMEAEEIAALVEGFAAAAAGALEAGLDGVEVNAGPYSLLRQFLSGVTNSRTDPYGQDRARLVEEVMAAVRVAVGPGAVVGLRLACDELAPWAGITPEDAPSLAARLAVGTDYVVAVRAPAFDAAGSRPDGHTEPGFALPLARAVRGALGPQVATVAQGSIVEVAMARTALSGGDCDLVEMTRAQIAAPDLVARVAAGEDHRIRPCVLCNQRCSVRDARNPIVSCVGEPSAGYETEDPEPGARWGPPAAASAPLDGRGVLVVGAGPAGLEAARVAALGGLSVTVADRRSRAGGALRAAAAGAGRGRLLRLAEWLEAECRALGVRFALGHEVGPDEVAGILAGGGRVLACTGGVEADDERVHDGTVPVVPARVLLEQVAETGGVPWEPAGGHGAVVVEDQVGDAVGISVAERLSAAGLPVVLVTGDPVPGTLLARTGDLAPANTRLARAGVEIVRRALVRGTAGGAVEVEGRFSGQLRRLPARALVVAGYARPGPVPVAPVAEGAGGIRGVLAAGDAVAPRGIYEAVLEGRRAAMALGEPR